MANETELEKIDRAAEYFERYFEFEDAVTVSKENIGISQNLYP